MNNKKVVFFLLLFVSISFMECQRRHLKQIASVPQLKRKYKKRVVTQKADFDYLSSKSKIEYTDGLDNFTANTSIRMKKDSVIWVSISPTLGVEVVRCLITKDSVLVINKLQKEYYLFSYSDLKEKLNFDLNFNLVQSILLGNPPFAEVDEDSSYDSNIDSSFTVMKQIRKNIEIENFIKNKTLKLEKIELRDVFTNNTLDINYQDFRPLENILFAFSNKISLKYKNKKGFQNIYIGIEHHKVETPRKDLEFPFKIKNRFERKE